MIFDSKQFEQLKELTNEKLLEERNNVRSIRGDKILEQKELLAKQTTLTYEIDYLIKLEQKITEAIDYNDKYKKREHFTINDIIGQYIQLSEKANRDRFIEELEVGEDVLFDVLEKEICNYGIYDLQMDILNKENLSEEFLLKVMGLELDTNMFKLDLKLKALKHPNVGEKVLEKALKDSFFDIKTLAANVAKERNFENVLQKASRVLDDTNNFTKLSNAQIVFETLKNGAIPTGDKEEIEDSLHFFEKRVKLSDDNEFVEKSLKEIDQAWKTFKSHFK